MKKVNETMKRKYQAGEIGIAYMKQEDTKGNLQFLREINQANGIIGDTRYYHKNMVNDCLESQPNVPYLPIEDFLEDVEEKEITPKEITEGILRCGEKLKDVECIPYSGFGFQSMRSEGKESPLNRTTFIGKQGERIKTQGNVVGYIAGTQIATPNCTVEIGNRNTFVSKEVSYSQMEARPNEGLKPITESVIDQMTDEFVTENEYRTEDEYMLERIKFNPHKDISTFIDRMPYKWIKWLKNNGYKVD